MCGIYGYQVKQGERLDPYEATMLGITLADKMEWRGRDSFGGLFWPSSDDLPIEVKGIGRVTEDGSKFLRHLATSQKLLAHTRAATTGAITIPNTHPFEIGDIVGVHNGIVHNHESLNKSLNRDFKVDSQHIFAHINENLDLEDLDAYGAVIYAKITEGYKSLYLGRSMNGQMVVARLFRDMAAKQDDNTHELLVFASTSDAISMAAKRLGFQYHTVEIKPELLYRIENGQIYDTQRPFMLGTKSYFSSNNNHNDTPSHHNHAITLSDYRERMLQGRNRAFQSAEDTVIHGETKKQRKARIRHERSMSEFYEHHTAEPTSKNIKSVITLTSCVRILNKGSRFPLMFCPECNCNIAIHTWGFCKDNADQKCKTPAGKTCHIPGLKSCRDCGCYLLENIHDKAPGCDDLIYCNNCHTYCTSDDLLISSEGVVGDVDEITEQDIIEAEVINPYGNLTGSQGYGPRTKLTLLPPPPIVVVDGPIHEEESDNVITSYGGNSSPEDIQRKLDIMEQDLATKTAYLTRSM